MKASALRRLVKLSISRDVRGALSSMFGVTVGVAALVFFVALGLGVAAIIRDRVFPLDASLVEVVPSQLSLGLLGGGKIDQPAVDRLKVLPGVTNAYRKMTVRVPAVTIYNGDFFGRSLRMGLEIIAVGVDAALVKPDVKLGDFSDPGEGQPIPAIVASRLIEIYNKSFAPARSLPQLSGSMLEGFQFPIELNRSFVTAAGAGKAVLATQGQVVGVSDRGLLAGITIPLETAIRINRSQGVDSETFTAVTLRVDEPSSVPRVVTAVKEMGFRVDDQERRMAENAGAAVAITTSAMALLSVLICVLAAFNIAHALSASVRAREKELGVMRAVGASKRDVFSLVFLEALVLGAAGGLAGSAVAMLGAFTIDAAAFRFLPEFPFKPESFFIMPWWLGVTGVALGVLAAVAGAFMPARRAAQLDPARALAG